MEWLLFLARRSPRLAQVAGLAVCQGEYFGKYIRFLRWPIE